MQLQIEWLTDQIRQLDELIALHVNNEFIKNQYLERRLIYMKELMSIYDGILVEWHTQSV